MSTKFTTIEFMLHNFMDKDFQSAFRPLYLMQLLLFSTKYNLRDNFVTPKNYASNMVSFIGALIFSLSHIFVLPKVDGSIDKVLNFTSTFDAGFYCFGFFLHLRNTINKSPEYVELILNVISIHRNVPCKNFIKNSRFWHWVLVVPIGIILVILLGLIWNFGKHALFFLPTISLLCFDFEILHAICIMVLINRLFSSWIIGVDSLTKANSVIQGKDRKLLLNKFLEILDSFKRFKQVFQAMILYHVTNTFIHALVYVHFMTLIIRAYLRFGSNQAIIAFVTLWVTKNLAIQCSLGLVCQLFYNNIAKAQIVCIRFMNSDSCTVEEKRICKNLLRVRLCEYSELRACALCGVGARLPLRLAARGATYVVLILQCVFINK